MLLHRVRIHFIANSNFWHPKLTLTPWAANLLILGIFNDTKRESLLRCLPGLLSGPDLAH
jgi:hypothetical protein